MYVAFVIGACSCGLSASDPAVPFGRTLCLMRWVWIFGAAKLAKTKHKLTTASLAHNSSNNVQYVNLIEKTWD